MTKFSVPYGRDFMAIDAPEENVISGPLDARYLPSLPNPKKAITEALENPIGCPPLSTLTKPAGKVVIAVSSKIRPGKYRKIILPIVLEELHKAGVKDKDILIIDAVGTNPPDSYELWIEMYGKEIVEKLGVVNHDCTHNCVYLGESEEYGDPVSINRNIAEADLVIAIDKMAISSAGYTGGAKMFAVGTASLDTINSTHIPSDLYHPTARLGQYEGNSFRDRLIAIGRKAEQESKSEKFFIVNALPNTRDEIAGIFAGDMVEAWHKGCELADKQYKVPVPRVADILIIGTPYPHGYKAQELGAELCFTQKTYPVPMVREGGVLIAVATLNESPEEGTTEHKLLQIMRNAFDYEDIIKLGEEWEKRFKERREKIPEGVVTAYGRAHNLKHYHGNIFVVGPEQPGLARDMHYTPVKKGEKALEMAFKIAGKDAGIIFVPHIREVCPQVKTRAVC